MKPQQTMKYEGRVIATVLGPGAVIVGNTQYVSDLTRTYIKLTLLHSFPVINNNGMTFTPANIAKSIKTIANQPLNKDHQLEGNPEPIFDGDNIVLGTMVEAFTNAKEDSELIPEIAYAVEVVAVLWNRFAETMRIVDSIGDGEKEYKISMEAFVVDPEKSHAWYAKRNGEWGYYEAITAEEFKAWQNGEYDKVALAAGGDGSQGSTSFWGAAFTLSPADENAVIQEVITASFKDGGCAFAAQAKESKKIIAQDNPKKENNKMNLTFKSIIASISTFVADMKNNKLEITDGDAKISNPIIDLRLWPNGDSGEYTASAYISHWLDDDHSSEKMIQLEYYGVSADGLFAALAAGDTPKRMTSGSFEEQLEVIKANFQGDATLAEKYKDYSSPEAVKAEIEKAVTAATKGAGKGDLYTKEQVDKQVSEQVATQVQAQVDEAIASIKETDKVLASRTQKLAAEGLDETESRIAMIASFGIDSAGDAKFDQYINTLKADNKKMIASLKDSNVTITEGVIAAVNMLDSTESPGYNALVASLVPKQSSVAPFNPSVAASTEDTNNEFTI